MKVSLIILAIISCCLVSFKPKKGMVVTGVAMIHSPYCGGAQPTAEMLKGNFQAYANTKFYVKSKINNSLKKGTVSSFITDSEGKFSFKIATPGNYYLYESGKMLSFAAFVKKHNKPSQFLSYVGDEKAKKAYSKPDAEIEIIVNKELLVIVRANCFSGVNPCLIYTGPPPP